MNLSMLSDSQKQTPHNVQGKENPTGQENLDLALSCDASKPMKIKDFTQVGKKEGGEGLRDWALHSLFFVNLNK